MLGDAVRDESDFGLLLTVSVVFCEYVLFLVLSNLFILIFDHFLSVFAIFSIFFISHIKSLVMDFWVMIRIGA